MEENLPCEKASMEEQRNICALVNHDKCEKPPYTEILNTVFIKSNSASNIIKNVGEQWITSSDNQVVKCDDSKNALQLNAKHYPNNKDKLYLGGNKLMLLLLKHHAETNTYKDLKLNRSDNECLQRSHSEQNEGTFLSKQRFQYEQLADKGFQKIHKNIHISKKIFSSDKCRGKLLNRISLILHKKYIREKSLQNNACGKKFTQNGNLIAHKRNYKGVKPFEFVAYGKNFVQSNGMVLHKIIHNGERTFKCSICGRKFFPRGNLTLHQRIHAGEKPFECEVCGKTFTLPRGLTAHKNTHTGEKHFECSVCGRKFARRGSLIVHERIHTGEKPFECETCGKTFIQRSGLIIHKRTHTGESFECSVCGRKFTQNINMITHKRIHTGEKPFECKVCGKTFTQCSGLTAHKKTHTGKKSF